MPHKERPNRIPTPEEIADECRKIREGWSEDKWAQQSQRIPWKVPLIDNPLDLRDRIQ